MAHGVHVCLLNFTHFSAFAKFQWCFSLSQVQENNTDAEGRLTLADALVYACNQGVEKVTKHHLFFFFGTLTKTEGR
jgi:hypothetical protein